MTSAKTPQVWDPIYQSLLKKAEVSKILTVLKNILLSLFIYLFIHNLFSEVIENTQTAQIGRKQPETRDIIYPGI